MANTSKADSLRVNNPAVSVVDLRATPAGAASATQASDFVPSFTPQTGNGGPLQGNGNPRSFAESFQREMSVRMPANAATPAPAPVSGTGKAGS